MLPICNTYIWRYTSNMTTILLSFILVALFFVGLICPHLAGKIQRKTDNKAGWLKRMANWFWDPITWWAKLTIESSRKAIKTVAGWGKKTHHNMPDDKK